MSDSKKDIQELNELLKSFNHKYLAKLGTGDQAKYIYHESTPKDLKEQAEYNKYFTKLHEENKQIKLEEERRNPINVDAYLNKPAHEIKQEVAELSQIAGEDRATLEKIDALKKLLSTGIEKAIEDKDGILNNIKYKEPITSPEQIEKDKQSVLDEIKSNHEMTKRENEKNSEYTVLTSALNKAMTHKYIKREGTSGNYTYLYHYSTKENLDVIDPHKQGTAAAGQETDRPNRPPRSYYYESPDKKDHEVLVTSAAKKMYKVKRPENIIDVADIEKMKAKFKVPFQDATDMENQIKSAGYAGYKNSAMGGKMAGVVALFDKQEVEKDEPVSKSLEISELNEILSKGKPLPAGTVRKWGGVDYRKEQSGQWLSVKEAKSPISEEAPKKDQPKFEEVKKPKGKKEEVDYSKTEHFEDIIRDAKFNIDEAYKKIQEINVSPQVAQNFQDKYGANGETPREALQNFINDVKGKDVKGERTSKYHTTTKISQEKLESTLNTEQFGMISAGKNPNSPQDSKMDDKAIEERYDKLRTALDDAGIEYVDMKGKYGEEEDSFLVMGADRKKLVELGKQFNQDSIIYGDKGNNEMIYTTGENEGKMQTGQGWEEKADATDMYSEMELANGEKKKFALNFNFDEMKDAGAEKPKKIKELNDKLKETKKDKTSKIKDLTNKLSASKEEIKTSLKLDSKAKPENFQMEGDLSNAKNWKAKILVGNSISKDQKKGQMDDVGYVMIPLNDKDGIIPMARGDEHQQGYDALMSYYKKQPKDYVSIYSRGTNYIYSADQKGEKDIYVKAYKKYLDNGGTDGIIRVDGAEKGAIKVKMSDYVAANGDVKFAKDYAKEGNLAPIGQDVVDNFTKVHEIFHKKAMGKELTNSDHKTLQKTTDKLIKLAESLEGIDLIQSDDFESTDTIIKKLKAANDSLDLNELEESLLGLAGLKNKMHNALRHPSFMNTDGLKASYGDIDAALEQFNQLTQYGVKNEQK